MHVPLPLPAASLRRLRRAAHWNVPLPEVADAVTALGEPMTELSRAWGALCVALAAYQALPSSDQGKALAVALCDVDRACVPFHGLSGWERSVSS